jgi:hypothetical protein
MSSSSNSNSLALKLFVRKAFALREGEEVTLDQEDLEKFATTIIKECANVAQSLRHVYPHQASETACGILLHFDVLGK